MFDKVDKLILAGLTIEFIVACGMMIYYLSNK